MAAGRSRNRTCGWPVRIVAPLTAVATAGRQGLGTLREICRAETRRTRPSSTSVTRNSEELPDSGSLTMAPGLMSVCGCATENVVVSRSYHTRFIQSSRSAFPCPTSSTPGNDRLCWRLPIAPSRVLRTNADWYSVNGSRNARLASAGN